MSTLQTTILKHPDSGSNNIQFDSSGRVGINTSPSAPLDVVGNDGIAIQSTAQTNEFLIRPSSSSADGIRFTQAGGAGDRMVVDSSGRVGIGVSNPVATLHLSNSNHGIAAGYVGGTLPNTAGIYTSSSTDYGQGYGSLIVQARAEYTGYEICFRSSNNERGKFLSDGTFQVNNGVQLKKYNNIANNVKLVIVTGDGGTNTALTYWNIAVGANKQGGFLGAYKAGVYYGAGDNISGSNTYAIYGFIDT